MPGGVGPRAREILEAPDFAFRVEALHKQAIREGDERARKVCCDALGPFVDRGQAQAIEAAKLLAEKEAEAPIPPQLRRKDFDARFEAREDTADQDEIGKRAGVSLLRYAAGLFDRCNEGIDQLFTAEELLRIASACERSKWDMLPDQWEQRQLEEAARNGTPPDWIETRRGVVAVYKNEKGG